MKDTPKNKKSVEAEFEALVIRFGWWNTLNTLAGMAYAASRFEMPTYSQSWGRMCLDLDDLARYYTKYLDREKKKDAKPPIPRNII
ncbi:MAG: hypothetical protein ABIK92_21895 [Pseudomonadota bacterium]